MKELCNFSSEAFVRVNFRSLASYWPRPWIDFGVPLGARRPPPPKGGPETSKRQPQTTQTVSLECLWATFGGQASRWWAGGFKETTQAPAAEARMFLETYSKTMSISLRRNVYAVEARSP